MEGFNAHYFIIGLSLVIILSYAFNIIAKKTSIPSVLMLILLGVLIHPFFNLMGIKVLKNIDFLPYLEVLGTIGLIKIVLEAALDLELKKEKAGLILKSLLIAFLGLMANVIAIAVVFYYTLDTDWIRATIYAIPLSIISSAIVIPSIGNLVKEKQEFLIYESALSDILGIMLFYFFIESVSLDSATAIFYNISGSIFLTILIAVVVSYGLIIVFQNIKTHVKFFLLFSFLLLIYSTGKLLHLSPLLIILFFGLIINNYKLFFIGKMKEWLNEALIQEVLDELKMMTAELAFLVRTFFFVLFGLSISLSSLLDVSVILISVVLILILYLLRVVIFGIFDGKDITPQAYVSPRGLITILLFFGIPNEYKIANFDSGILLFVIIVTSGVMTWALIKEAKNKSNNIDTVSEIVKEEEVKEVVEAE